jgi:hypothetical protein
MNELSTAYSYSEFKKLALMKNGWDGDIEFISLLSKAVIELKDDDLAVFINLISGNFIFKWSGGNIYAIHISFIREYVRRVEIQKEQEEQKRERTKDCGHNSWKQQLDGSNICSQCGCIKPLIRYYGNYSFDKDYFESITKKGILTASGINALYNQYKPSQLVTCKRCKGIFHFQDIYIDVISGKRYCSQCYGRKP